MEPLQQQTNWLTALGQVQIAVARVGLAAALVAGLALVVVVPGG